MRRRDRGQATVELALTLPLVMFLLLGLLQVVVVARDHLAVWHAARVGVRAASVSSSPVADGEAAARAATTLADPEVVVQVGPVWVTVTVSHHHRTSVPLVGLVIPDVTLSATATMAREPP